MNPKATVKATGLVKINNHCLFVWHEAATTGERWFERNADHCRPCLTELERLHGRPPLFDDPDAIE